MASSFARPPARFASRSIAASATSLPRAKTFCFSSLVWATKSPLKWRARSSFQEPSRRSGCSLTARSKSAMASLMGPGWALAPRWPSARLEYAASPAVIAAVASWAARAAGRRSGTRDRRERNRRGGFMGGDCKPGGVYHSRPRRTPHGRIARRPRPDLARRREAALADDQLVAPAGIHACEAAARPGRGVAGAGARRRPLRGDRALRLAHHEPVPLHLLCGLEHGRRDVDRGAVDDGRR